MGAPKNFYNAVDLAKFGIEDIDKRVLPQVSAANNGKIAKVVEGKWALGDDRGLPSVSGWSNGVVMFAYNGGWVVNETQNIYKKLNGIVTSSATLSAGETSITINNDNINSRSLIDVYTDVLGVDPTNITTSSGSCTLTFDEQAVDVSVRLVVM